MMWEVFSYGKQPYGDMTPDQLTSKILSGYRLPKTEKCPDDLYKMLLKCWNLDAKSRPSSTEVVDVVSKC